MESNERIVELLEQQLAWTRCMAIPQVRVAILGALKTEQERKAFEASDGTKTTREVAAAAGIASPSTILNYWRRWRALGIASEAPGRKACRLISLADLSIPLKPLDENIS